MKLKRIVALVLILTIFMGIVPFNFVNAETQDYPIKVENTDYGIFDSDVVANQITLEDGYSFVSHQVDFSYIWDNFGDGYAIVCDNSTLTYYLVGTKGVVKSFYTDDGTKPSLSPVFNEYSADTPYAVYSVKNPETGKYDVFNANTCEYFEYSADRIYAYNNIIYDTDPDYCRCLARIEKNEKYGILNNSGKMIYNPIYNEIYDYKNCLIGRVSTITDGVRYDKYAILSNDGGVSGNKFYSEYIEKNDIVFAVKELTEEEHLNEWAVISPDNPILLTDYKYRYVKIVKFNDSYYRIGSQLFEAIDMYGETDYYYQNEIITDNGNVLDVCTELGYTSSSVGIYHSSVDVCENALKIYITDNYGYYERNDTGFIDPSVVLPQFDLKYFIVSPNLKNIYYHSDTRENKYNNFFGRYGNIEVIDDADRGVKLYDNNDNLINNICSDYSVSGNYMLYENYEDSSYVLYDIVNKKPVLEDFYAINNIEHNGSPEWLVYNTLILKETAESSKYGLFDAETGNFSGYIFEENPCSDSVSDLFVSGKRKVWKVNEGFNSTFINDKFKIICVHDELLQNGTNLIRHNSETNGIYNMSIIDYDGNVKADFNTKVYYQYPAEAYITVNSNDDEGLINSDGRIILENDASGIGGTINGLTAIYTNEYEIGSASVIDKNGNALIYGKFDVERYRYNHRAVGYNGFISFRKDNSVYIYDYSACLNNGEHTDSSVVTEDSLFGEYHSFLKNNFYNSMTETAVNQTATALSHYSDSAKVVAFTKSALNGNTGYVLKKLVSMIPQVDIDSKKAKQDMALEYLNTIDTDVIDDLLSNISATKKIIGKINETQKSINNIKNDINKANFAAIWEYDNVSKSDIYGLIDVLNQNQDKFDKFINNTGETITTVEYLMTYLTIYMLQDGLVKGLMKLVPKDSELYEGLNYINLKQKKIGIVGFIVEMLTEETYKCFAKAINQGLLKAANFKNPTLAGLVIELGCKLAAKCIDSPDLEAVDKATLALANTLTLKKAVENYQTKISDNYEKSGGISVEDLKADYSLLCSTYYKSIFTGLKYAKDIATDNEKVLIERYTNEFEKKLIYRSYIKTCLLNARTRWEYTVNANNAVISKLKADYPSGEGRIPWIELRNNYNTDFLMNNVVIRPEYAIDIPAIIDGYEVNSIGNGAFGGDNRLNGVYVPDSVTEIENNAFKNCSSIDTVYLGSDVETIGDSAFANCDSLSTINIPDSVISVGDNTFDGVKDLVVTGSNEALLEDLNSENVKSNVRNKEIKSIEFVSEPTHKIMEMQDEIDTTGMVVMVTYSDDSKEKINSGFYAEIANRKVGENTVAVCYNGFYLNYIVEITESQCSYTVYYLDETGDEITKTLTGTATAGSTINLEIPKVQGYTPVNTEQTEVIGYNNDFVVRYTEIPKTSFIIGDVNGDEVISIVDATEIQKYLAELSSLNDNQLAVADVNCDGKISILDATEIQKYLAELIPSLG